MPKLRSSHAPPRTASLARSLLLMPAAPSSDGAEAAPINSDWQSEAGHKGARIKMPEAERKKLSHEKNLFSQSSSGVIFGRIPPDPTPS